MPAASLASLADSKVSNSQNNEILKIMNFQKILKIMNFKKIMKFSK